MRTIQNDAEIKRIERERALVGVYVDRAYDRDKIEWVMEAREGFDTHVGNSWHLLIPVKNGYGVDTWVGPEHYGTQLAARIIDTLEISYVDLPCIVFRAQDENFYFLKLGDKNRSQFFEEIGRIADLARECANTGPADPEEFRDHVNRQVANHLRRRRLLSALRTAVPALERLLGSAINIGELV